MIRVSTDPYDRSTRSASSASKSVTPIINRHTEIMLGLARPVAGNYERWGEAFKVRTARNDTN